MSNQQVEQLEVEIDQARSIIALSDDINKLYSYKPFKNVILDQYFREEAVRLVALKGDREFQTPERQEAVLRQMDGIAALNAFLHRIMMAAQNARDSLDEMQNAQAEALEEDLQGE